MFQGRKAEINIIIQYDYKIIPVEGKSADNAKANSLKVYMDKYKPKYAIKIYSKDFVYEDNKKVVPLYTVFCIN